MFTQPVNKHNYVKIFKCLGHGCGEYGVLKMGFRKIGGDKMPK